MRSGIRVLLTALMLSACSSAFDETPALPNDSDGASVAGSTSFGGEPGSGGSAPVIPPEREEDPSYRAPVVSGRWVWTANPDTGKIAVVDAKTFNVRLADAGLGPTYLTALPSATPVSRALVINVGSHDATLLRASATGPVAALGPIPLSPDANTWTVSKTGKFAIAWTDSHGLTPDPTQGFQDISVVDLRTARPVGTRLSVGFLPSRVAIDDVEQQAYVVATSGISVIDLVASEGPRVRHEEPLADDVQEDAQTRDVSVMPDGSYALVRREGSPQIGLIELATGARSSVTLTGAITDLDLVADAKSALAVVRGSSPLPQGAGNGQSGGSSGGAGGDLGSDGGSDAAGAAGFDQSAGGAANSAAADTRSTLAILPLPGIFADPTRFTTVSLDPVFGLVSIAPQGTAALLYTNAIQSNQLTILETAQGEHYLDHRSVDVRGDVRDVFPSPDGAYAIVSVADAAGKPGFAAVPVANALPARVQTTEAPVFAVAQSTGPSARAIVTVSDGTAHYAAYVVRMPELVIDPVTLPSRPLAGGTGIVPDAGMAYIAQEHPQGRITFIDLETGVPRTITGFELSAKVSDGR